MHQKRVNFNMYAECHALLKSVCALKGVTVSEFVNGLVAAEFRKLAKEDNQVRTMFLSGTYTPGGNAYLLKQTLIEELKSTNDSSA